MFFTLYLFYFFTNKCFTHHCGRHHFMPSISCALLKVAAASVTTTGRTAHSLHYTTLAHQAHLERCLCLVIFVSVIQASLGLSWWELCRYLPMLWQFGSGCNQTQGFKCLQQLKWLCSPGSFDIFFSVCLCAVLRQSFNRTCQESRQFLSTSV